MGSMADHFPLLRPLSAGMSLLPFLLLTLSAIPQGPTQDIAVHGFFLEDSVALGAPTPYLLIAKYPIGESVRFPQETDETAYAPFEYRGKRFVPSVGHGGYVTDSAWYEVATFETEPLQHLKLPIYHLNGDERVEIYAKTDTIAVTGLLATDAQAPTLKERLSHQFVALQRNYPVIFGLLVGLLGLLAALFFASRRKVVRAIHLIRLRRAHERFSRAYAKKLRGVHTSADHTSVEQTLFFFKGYLEQLESIPYTKLSTREVARLPHKAALVKILMEVDRIIYGGTDAKEAYKLLDTLDQIGFERYQKRVDTIKYGG